MKQLTYLAGDAAFVLVISATVAIVLIYRVCIYGRKAVLADILYAGHVFVLTVLFFILYSFIYFIFGFHQQRRPFEASPWRANKETRVEMIDDLMKQKLIEHKRLDEIMHVLGKPMFTVKYKSAIVKVYYYLGVPEKAFVLDPEFLVIELKNDTAEKYYLRLGGPNEK